MAETYNKDGFYVEEKSFSISEHLSKKIKFFILFTIILVIFRHSTNLRIPLIPLTYTLPINDLNGFLQKFITHGLVMISTPMLFIISGYLFFISLQPSQNSFLSKYQRRFFTLLLPYVFWCVWGFILMLLCGYLFPHKPFPLSETIASLSTLGIIDKIFIRPVPYQFWFIRNLMALILFSPLIYLGIKKLRAITLTVVLLGWFLAKYPFIISMKSICFFVLGAYFALEKPRFVIKKPDLFLIIWVLLALVGTYLEFYHRHWIALYIIKFSIIAGLIGIWFGYDRYADKMLHQRWFFTFSKFSFFIFAFHEPVLSLFKNYIYALIGVTPLTSFILFIASPLFIIPFATFVAFVLSGCVRPFYNFIVGGR